MSKVVYTNKLQYEVLTSDERITVITAEAGAGSTYALILKALQSCLEHKINCTFFVPAVTSAMAAGGIVEAIKSVAGESVRFSDKSMIFTFPNDSKVKIIPCRDDNLIPTMGLSRELMLFDANVPNKFKEFHLKRARDAVVVDTIAAIEKEDSWANNLNLLVKERGKIVGFVEGIKHIKGYLSDNYLFDAHDRYRELVEKYASYRMRTEF